MSKEAKAAAFNDWTDSDLTRLVLQAKHAYDTRQLKNCLTYTNLLLQADPENTEGRGLLAAIRYEIDQDLNKARELLANPHLEDQPEVFGRGAEIIIKRILHLDPENQEAKALAGMLHVSPAVPVAPTPSAAVETFKVVSPTLGARTAGAKKSTSGYGFIPIAAVIVVVIGITAVMAFNRRPSTASQPPVAQAAVVPPVQTNVERNFEPRLEPTATTVSEAHVQPTITPVRQAAAPEPSSIQIPPTLRVTAPTTPVTAPSQTQSPVVTVAAARPAPPARTVATTPGTLAVSSRSAAEIYEGDKYLGSTPTTLELSPGAHTLEYRHDDLRSLVTHVIKSGETTNAMIAFETAVRINAKPWANVFIQGAERRSLGQTPLSEVRVPVGGTLVFENPNFTQKYYRVTGKETAIQIVFP